MPCQSHSASGSQYGRCCNWCRTCAKTQELLSSCSPREPSAQVRRPVETCEPQGVSIGGSYGLLLPNLIAMRAWDMSRQCKNLVNNLSLPRRQEVKPRPGSDSRSNRTLLPCCEHPFSAHGQ